MVLDLLDLLLEVRERDLSVLDDEGDLEHLDTVTDGDELGSTPGQTVLLDSSDLSLHGLHVGLVVPRLDLQGNDRLGDLELLTGSELLSGLSGLGLVVGGDSLLLDSLGLGIGLLVVRAEEVNVLVVLLGGLSGGGGGGRGKRGSLGEGVELGLERGDVSVPSGSVGELGLGRGGWR